MLKKTATFANRKILSKLIKSKTIMSAYRQILYHIVFRTKNNKKSIPIDNSSLLFAYIWGIIKNKKGTLFRINAMQDHIHILSDLHPSIALADYIKDIKVSSSKTS
jgi:REP element-mobilizing transposase RayT